MCIKFTIVRYNIYVYVIYIRQCVTFIAFCCINTFIVTVCSIDISKIDRKQSVPYGSEYTNITFYE